MRSEVPRLPEARTCAQQLGALRTQLPVSPPLGRSDTTAMLGRTEVLGPSLKIPSALFRRTVWDYKNDTGNKSNVRKSMLTSLRR